jgi:hypothetical protein
MSNGCANHRVQDFSLGSPLGFEKTGVPVTGPSGAAGKW